MSEREQPDKDQEDLDRLTRGPQPDQWAPVDVERVQREDLDPWQHQAVMMKCRTCMAFVVKERDKQPGGGFVIRLGRCRRHAPTMQGYPAVFENDWCLDHKVDENKL